MAGQRFALSSLANEKVESVPGSSKPTLAHMPPDQIAPTPLNPRQDFSRDKLLELGESMRGGQLQPCVGVSRTAYLKLFPEHTEQVGNCRVVMAAGERRWMAAREVGLELLDIHIRGDLADSRERFLTAVLAENMERADFNLIEQARGLENMLQLTDGEQVRAATQLGKSKQWFSQHLGLLRLTEEMQALVIDGSIKSFRDMRRYSALPADQQMAAWQADQVAQEQKKSEPKPPKQARRKPPEAPKSAAVQPSRSEPQTDTQAPQRSNTELEPAQTKPADGYTAVYPKPDASLSIAGKAEGSPTGRPENLPAPRDSDQGQSPATAPVKMPWEDGRAIARFAIHRMTPEELDKLRDLLIEHSPMGAGQARAVPVPWDDEVALGKTLFERVGRQKIPALIDILMEGC